MDSAFHIEHKGTVIDFKEISEEGIINVIRNGQNIIYCSLNFEEGMKPLTRLESFNVSPQLVLKNNCVFCEEGRHSGIVSQIKSKHDMTCFYNVFGKENFFGIVFPQELFERKELGVNYTQDMINDAKDLGFNVRGNIYVFKKFRQVESGISIGSHRVTSYRMGEDW